MNIIRADLLGCCYYSNNIVGKFIYINRLCVQIIPMLTIVRILLFNSVHKLINIIILVEAYTP